MLTFYMHDIVLALCAVNQTGIQAEYGCGHFIGDQYKRKQSAGLYTQGKCFKKIEKRGLNEGCNI